MVTKTDRLLIKLETDGAGNVKAQLAGVEQGLEGVGRQASKSDVLLSKAKGALVGLVGFEVLKGIVGITAEFQKYNAQLVTVTGSQDAASAAMDRLRDLASRTPFQLGEMVDAFVKMKALGLDPSEKALISFGNTAAAMGKDLNQVVEAVADATTGEFERLKEFGIKAKSEGDRVRFTFQGLTTEVGNNASEINAYLESIGNNQFAGAMERQADTLGGAWSNLQDSAAQLANAIGTVLAPSIVALTGTISDAITETASFVEWLGKMITFDFGPLEESNRRIDNLRQSIQETTQALEVAQADKWYDTIADNAAAAELYSNKLAGLKAALAEAIKEQEQLLDGMLKTEPATNNAGAATETLTTKTKQAASEAAKLAEKYREMLANYGLTEAQQIRLAASAAALTAKTEAEAAAVLEAAEALATLIEERERNEAQVQANTEAYEFEQAAIEALNAALEAHSTALQQAIDRYNPLGAALRDIEQDIRDLEQAVVEGREGATEALRNAKREQEALLREAAKIELDIAYQTADEQRKLAVDSVGELSSIFRNGMLDGFKDGGDDVVDWFKNWLVDLATLALEQKIIVPIQQQLLGTGGQGGQGGFLSSLFGGGQGGTSGLPSFLQGQGTGYDSTGNVANGGSFLGSLFGNGGGQSGGGAGGFGQAAGLVIGAYNVYQTYTDGPGGGQGALSGALSGATAGASFGPWGALIGGIIGAVAGFFGGPDDPRIQATSDPLSNRIDGRIEGRGTSRLGSIYTRTEGPDGSPAGQEVADALIDVDNQFADLLVTLGYSAAELEELRETLRGWSADLEDSNASVAAIIDSRVSAIIDAVAPDFSGFLNSIDDIEERVNAFVGVVAIQEAIENLDETLAGFGTDGPLELLRTQLHNLDTAVETTAAALAEAIAAQDPAAIVEAQGQLQLAIVRRYEAELRLIEDLQAAIEQARNAARSFDFSIEQRLAGLSGDNTRVIGLAGNEIGRLANRVLNPEDTQQALADLNAFVATVDLWLRESRAQVQAWLNEQTAAINARLAALDAEEQAIYDAANARLAALREERAIADQAAQEAAAQQAAQQAEYQRAIAISSAAAEDMYRQINAAQQAAMNEALEISREWLSILVGVRDLIDSITVSAANPVGGFGRLSILDQRIDSLTSRLDSASAGDRPDIARQLIEALQGRLGLAQELFQRPSGEYLDVYNSTLARLRELEEIADGESDLAELQYDVTQATYTTAVGIGIGVETVREAIDRQSDLQLQLTEEEQARLDAIEDERKKLQQALNEAQLEAARRLAHIDERASEYYTWAQQQGQILYQRQIDEHQQMLDAITGGVDPDAYIAQLTAESRDYLRNIQDDLRAFLQSITGLIGNDGSGSGSGFGGTGLGPRDEVPIRPKTTDAVTLVVNVTGNDAGSIRTQVEGALQAGLPQLASRIKRELAAA